MPKKIPDRWESYSKMGNIIHGTTIMPIKVPLKEHFTSSLPPEEMFSPSSLLHLLQDKNLKLGTVVDLTYTTKYYDSQFFTQNGITYKKVFTAGHVIPDNKTYSQFANAIKETEKEGEVICVHCTHGLNRSGYLICRYMIEALNMEPRKAIRLFEEARGHKMERQNYIDDLLQRKPGRSPRQHDHKSRQTHNRHNDISFQTNNRGSDRLRHERSDVSGHGHVDTHWRNQWGSGGERVDRSRHTPFNRDGIQWNDSANFRTDGRRHQMDSCKEFKPQGGNNLFSDSRNCRKERLVADLSYNNSNSNHDRVDWHTDRFKGNRGRHGQERRWGWQGNEYQGSTWRNKHPYGHSHGGGGGGSGGYSRGRPSGQQFGYNGENGKAPSGGRRCFNNAKNEVDRA